MKARSRGLHHFVVCFGQSGRRNKVVFEDEDLLLSRLEWGEAMFLEWWSPSIDCEGRKEQASEVWIRVVGLPLHLWSEDILKELGDKCGGFVVMDKATIHRKDLRWARILVKNSYSRKPSSVNMLAGARSYELQIWWEIQPKVVEVYPKVYRPKGLLTRPSKEDEGNSRANERVRGAIGKRLHTAQELQWVECQQMGKGLSGSDGGVVQRLKCAGIPKVGPKICCVSQNNLGIREINVGDTHGREWASKTRHLGLQTENNEAQKLFPRQEFCMGQSPKIHREQDVCPTVKKAVGNQRVKCKELSDEKTKNTKKHNTVSMQKSDIEGDEKEQQVKSSKFMSGQKKAKDMQLKDVGNNRYGSIYQRETQKFMGERQRDEEPSPNDSSGRNFGLQHGPGVGQSPSGHHGVYVGQSPCNKMKAVRIVELPRLKDMEIETAGMPGRKLGIRSALILPSLKNLSLQESKRREAKRRGNQ